MEDLMKNYESLKKTGKTPDDISTIVIQLCKKFLANKWTQINDQQLNIERINGGFTNQIYRCSLKDNLIIHENDEPKNDDPNNVIIRLYGPKYINVLGWGNSRFSDAITSIYAANNKLGPQIYGLFENGHIEEYIPSKNYGREHQSDMNTLKNIAQKLSHYHFMKVPFDKCTQWFETMVNGVIDRVYAKYDIQKLVNKYHLKTLKNIDLKKEKHLIIDYINSIGSSIVFCHNDFLRNNILIKENNDVVFCDFEYSMYSYRGFDFGNFFSQWNDTSPFEADPPSDEIFEIFANEYRNESIKIKGNKYANDKRNGVLNIVNEIKVFLMFMFLLTCLRCLQYDDRVMQNMGLTIQFYSKAADKSASEYLKLKEKFALF